MCSYFFPEGSHDRCHEGRARQWAKIREITESLRLAGFQSLDEQAEAIGLSRSTTWSILKGLHKNSGLSTTTIFRVLSHKRLPAPVRTKLLEYVEEKARGLYGDSPRRVEQFKERWARLPASQSQTVHPQRPRLERPVSADHRGCAAQPLQLGTELEAKRRRVL